MKIEYTIKSHYGTDHFYVVDTAIAETIRVLTGRKTITATDIKCLEILGHKMRRIKQ